MIHPSPSRAECTTEVEVSVGRSSRSLLPCPCISSVLVHLFCDLWLYFSQELRTLKEAGQTARFSHKLLAQGDWFANQEIKKGAGKRPHAQNFCSLFPNIGSIVPLRTKCNTNQPWALRRASFSSQALRRPFHFHMTRGQILASSSGSYQSPACHFHATQ